MRDQLQLGMVWRLGQLQRRGSTLNVCSVTACGTSCRPAGVIDLLYATETRLGEKFSTVDRIPSGLIWDVNSVKNHRHVELEDFRMLNLDWMVDFEVGVGFFSS